MVGATVGISRPTQLDMPRALPDMPQPAGFGGFYCDPASNLLAYRSDGREMPTVAPSPNKSWAIFSPKKGLASYSLGLIYHSVALDHLQSCDTIPFNISSVQFLAPATKIK
jgi:hypothetical protein